MNKMKILFLALVVLFSINVSAQDKNGGRLTPELFRACRFLNGDREDMPC